MNVTMTIALTASAAVALSACGARADSAPNAGGSTCDPGSADAARKLGSSSSITGPGANSGKSATTMKAYFDYLNEKDGGVEFGDGVKRTIDMTVLDDAYDPSKTVPNARELIEGGAFALVNVNGTSPNEAIWEYANQKGVPNLFMSTGSDVWLEKSKGGDPWGMAWLPQYGWEAHVFADYITQRKPNAKVGLLYQNDGYGKTVKAGFEKAFEGTDATIVAAESFEQSGSSTDAQVSKLKASGADVFLNYATGTHMTQSLKKKGDLGWRPLTIVGSASNAIPLVQPAGESATADAVSLTWLKDVNSPSWDADPGMRKWREFASAKGVDLNDSAGASGYSVAQLFVESLKAMKGCTRQALLDANHNLKGAKADLLLPGVTVSTTPDYPYYINTVQLLEFDGKAWQAEGEPVDRTP